MLSNAWRLAGFLPLAAGIILIAISSQLPPYKDQSKLEKVIEKCYGRMEEPLIPMPKSIPPYIDLKQEKIDRDNKPSKSLSQEYREVRESILTPKYRMQDYGACLIIVGVFSFILLRKKKANLLDSRIPSKKAYFYLIGNLAAFSTGISFVAELVRDQNRGEFPPWADSLAIPLAGLPALFIICFCLANLYAVYIYQRFAFGASVKWICSIKHYWKYPSLILLYVPILLTTVLLVSFIMHGEPFSFFSCLIWDIFFICLFVGHVQPLIAKSNDARMWLNPQLSADPQLRAAVFSPSDGGA